MFRNFFFIKLVIIFFYFLLSTANSNDIYLSLKKDKVNEVQLFEVNAEIVRKNQEVIYIYSKTANYNKINNNTVFRKNVNVNYVDQTISSDTLNLNFKENIIEILDNVNYFNSNTKINADKV